jgi:hypothetical protein
MDQELAAPLNGDVAEIHANGTPNTPAKPQSEQKSSSESASLIASPTLASPQPDDPIEALDYLEDAIEEVGKILPNLQAMAPEKPAKKENVAKSASKPTTLAKPKTAAGKPAPRPGPSLVKTTQPSATATRSRAMPASTPKPTVSKRHSTIVPAKSSKDAATPAPKAPTTDYLASRRRPISLKIPLPPERARSAKPPTHPTFTLPGDSLTAKRKAAAEERKRKEEEELARRREFKARPVPGAVARPRPASMIVRQTTSSRARMSVCGAEGLSALGAAAGGAKSPPAAPAGLRRAGTVTGATTLTSESKAKAKAAADRAAARAKRASVAAAAAAPATAPPKRAAAPPRASIIVLKRVPAGASPAASPRGATKPGVSRATSVALSVASSAAGSGVTAEDAAAQRQKARAIFNRDRAEGEARERARRDKEEAARRARAEAAEKGRIASREWAEKHKRRVASAAATAKVAQVKVV